MWDKSDASLAHSRYSGRESWSLGSESEKQSGHTWLCFQLYWEQVGYKNWICVYIENSFKDLYVINSCFFLISLDTIPAVTALKFQDGLHLGVGTSTGQVQLYDIRSNKPFYTKDHMYGLPIKCIDFHQKMDLVYSMDSSIVKIWEKNTVSVCQAFCAFFIATNWIC